MGGGPPCFPQGFTCPVVLWVKPGCLSISLTGLSPSLAEFPKLLQLSKVNAVWLPATPKCMHSGLGSSPFASRYSGNRFFFLFLRLLRCFSSPAYLPYTMDSCMDTWSSSMWVAPFGYPRIDGYLLLPEAFRSLSRPSSAVSAKASALRPFCLLLRSFRPSVGYLERSHASPRQRDTWRQLMFLPD